MDLAPDRPNVELRGAGGDRIVALSFPYDAWIVHAARTIPGRRFDWDTKEWRAPATDQVGVYVADILARFPDLTSSDEVSEWLRGVDSRWIGNVSTARHDGHGWFLAETRAGQVPAELQEGAIERDAEAGGGLLIPFSAEAATLLREQPAVRLDLAADRCVDAVAIGEDPPPARLVLKQTVDGPQLALHVLWDHEAGAAFEKLLGINGTRETAPDPWLIEGLDGFVGLHGVVIDGMAAEVIARLRVEHEAAMDAIRRSRATDGEPIEAIAPLLGGTLEPFQWAGVRYALETRRTFIADEQGLGKTVEALAALEADDAFPAIVVCPASLKLNWQREAEKWLPHRDVALVSGRGTVAPRADITIVNYEIVASHREELTRRRPRAIVVDESHYCKNPRAKRTHAVRRLANAIPADGLRLALTGTPVLNHAEELIAQLRVIGRLEDFGSGARFARQFEGALSEQRLHWHLRRRCFVRRLKVDVLPQLPPKRQVIVPIELDNAKEYELAEKDVIAWLREQPLDLAELDAKIARTLRAKRLAQLTALQQLAGRGKLTSALGWIHDFLASGEPLVVFARHVEVQDAVIERFPDALSLRGRDSLPAREAAIASFQAPDGPQLIVCATRVAAQGITLTRASNVAFLEQEWTPAMHDQAEDRCHRIGQRDAVTAWYLLAAETIDETMARLIASKRGLVGAVTDGRPDEGRNLVEAVVKELREGQPFRRLRPVA
jgi:SWI/SNF-related matrix-associated actin-dependent regulator 1 of chromatin subfamily A